MSVYKYAGKWNYLDGLYVAWRKKSVSIEGSGFESEAQASDELGRRLHLFSTAAESGNYDDVAEFIVYESETRKKWHSTAGNSRCAGWVYFVRDTDAVKIGWSGYWPSERVSNGQTFNPRELSLVAAFRGSIATEALFHGVVNHSRIRGEWFGADHALRLVAEMRKIGIEDGVDHESVVTSGWSEAAA